jgi:predicted RecB family nuclease
MATPRPEPSFTATALGIFLDCTHRTVLDLAAFEGRLERPGQNEIERLLLAKRGTEHEQRVLDHYQRSGARVVSLPVVPGNEAKAKAAELTLAAMADGADVIYQGVLSSGNWAGRPDFLLKIPGRGGRWAHHYEVVDAKLAQEPRASAVLQLCVYTEHLASLQEFVPEHFHIASGHDASVPLALRVADYLAYYRSVRRRFESFLGSELQVSEPEPVEHCGVCPWWKRCESQRREEDHLSLVANITRRQRDRLSAAGISRRTELARLPEGTEVDGVETLARLREQAKLQVDGPTYRLLLDGDRKLGTAGANELVGLEALPRPKPGDLFLDLEGDSFVGGEGLEYLFGLLELGEPSTDDFFVRDAPGAPRHFAYWADTPAAEKRAFEAVIDRIVRGREEFSTLHVYHFGHRESDALKKLSCRHKTRERELDRLLREHVLVDLHPIVRHGLLAGVEAYGLKQLETLHGFQRNADLREAARAMQLYGWWLETGEAALPLETLRARIEEYNREDCLSTWRLRNWLEGLRPEFERLQGRPARRPASDAIPAVEEREQERASAEVAAKLMAGLPEDAAEDNADQRARRLQASLLDWHWREAKSGWWEYHRARELAAEDRLGDRSALSLLSFQQTVGQVKQSIVYRYTFPEQEHAIRRIPTPIDPATQKDAGDVVDVGAAHIDLKRSKKRLNEHPVALIPGKPIESAAHAESLLSLGRALLGGVRTAPQAALQLLYRLPPSAGQPPGESLIRSGESVEDALLRIARSPEGVVLAVQGPPGSGKTYQAAQLILALIRDGKRVGVTANSHAVILEVLKKVCDLAADNPVRALHVRGEDDEGGDQWPFELCKDKAKVRERLEARELDLVGGTSWTWAHPSFERSVDVLVVDEAGQVSLANALSVSRAARSLVLVGDPAQLEQPQKGVHPPGAGVSALEHLLGGNALTIPHDLGIFLPNTRRLHPLLCAFISQTFYEGRLQPIPGLERQAIGGAARVHGSGLRHALVPHRGNTNRSPEEVETIVRLIADLGLDRDATSAFATFTDRHGTTRPLTRFDVLVVAPYNAQVAALRRALPAEIRVGTVDKFQGRQAPIVLYSLTSSSADDAPRGLEFLLSPNRLNVAISRAQALSIVIASPELARTACKTPRQMQLVNALCAYLEMSQEV